MNILLVSECSGNALKETRRLIDQFAERRGERTWQTPITQAGLVTLRRLLRQSARKNTAVACHWVRAKDHTELLWIVGNRRAFDESGGVPIQTTGRKMNERSLENEWHTLETIRLLAAMAALWHDVGKANDVFAAKLRPGAKPAKDPYRHEWVSLRLFQTFVGSQATTTDDDWLERLSAGAFASLDESSALYRDGLEPLNGPAPPTLAQLPPIARAIGWLILTHHRLPTPLDPHALGPASISDLLQAVDVDWCGAAGQAADETAEQFEVRLRNVWSFAKGLPHLSSDWRERVSRLAKRLATHRSAHGIDWLRKNPFVAHIARMALMLSDHQYSSLPATDVRRVKVAGTYDVYANTDSHGNLKQRLDEHLIGVEQGAHRIVQMLPRLEKDLPRLTRTKGFSQRTSHAAFVWQNKAFDLAIAVAEESQVQGFFGVNMASTGTGKTLGNGRILYGLADPALGARFSVALGLRTLTLQTGVAFRERIKLDDGAMAIMVGGVAVRQLFEREQKKQGQVREATVKVALSVGSESAAELLPDDGYVVYEGALSEGPLRDWLTHTNGPGQRNSNAQKLVEAPVLVCTVDHLMPAVESTRGGHQIAPMLRLLTSDLVLDEVDDFGMEDLPALARLTYWAGLLGSRVLLSSATLPPSLVQGLFAAYLAGRTSFQANRGSVAQSAPRVVCAWFDEFGCDSSQHGDEAGLRASHDAFVHKRVARLAKQPERRRVEFVPFPEAAQLVTASSVGKVFRKRVIGSALVLHKRNAQVDSKTGAQVSFGLVRMANIGPLWQVAHSMLTSSAPQDTHFHICVYHSRHPLLVRSRIESVLDTVLRRDPHDAQATFRHAEVREAIDRNEAKHHLFIVIATAVAEVGRDHDYDWAVVEPSSMRSIIQLAGRVRRHRPDVFAEINMALFDYNWRALNTPSGIAFSQPGFETKGRFALTTHKLSDLLHPSELDRVSAKPRIVETPTLDRNNRLSDLEHARLRALMLARGTEGEADIRQFWEASAHLTGYAQRLHRFRARNTEDATFAFVPDEDDELRFMREQKGIWTGADAAGQHLRRVEVIKGLGTSAWPVIDLAAEIASLANDLSMSPDDCAKRFGTVDLPLSYGGKNIVWNYASELGFTRVI